MQRFTKSTVVLVDTQLVSNDIALVPTLLLHRKSICICHIVDENESLSQESIGDKSRQKILQVDVSYWTLVVEINEGFYCFDEKFHCTQRAEHAELFQLNLNFREAQGKIVKKDNK